MSSSDKKPRRLNVAVSEVDLTNLETIQKKIGAPTNGEAVRRALAHYAQHLTSRKVGKR